MFLALHLLLYYGGGAPINPAMAAGGDTIPSRDKSFDQFQPKISLTLQVKTLPYMHPMELVLDQVDLTPPEVLLQQNFG